MIILKLYDVSISDTSSVYTQLVGNDLLKHTHLHYICSAENIKRLESIKCNSVLINLSDIDNSVELDDLIMDIIETPYTPILRLPNNEEVRHEFLELADVFGLSYIPEYMMTLVDEPKIDNILDYVIVNEIFNGIETTNNLYSPLDYGKLVKIRNGSVVIGDTSVKLEDFDFCELWSMQSSINYKDVLNVKTEFSRYISTPIPFVLSEDIKTTIENIDKYKQSVFYKFVSMTARDILTLPDEVRDFVVKGNYIPLDTIKKLEGMD